MRKHTTALVIAAALAATIAAVPALYAEDSQTPSGPMMKGSMMADDNNGGGMMGMMKMMNGCSNMMQNARPNDQWRQNTPSEREKTK